MQILKDDQRYCRGAGCGYGTNEGDGCGNGSGNGDGDDEGIGYGDGSEATLASGLGADDGTGLGCGDRLGTKNIAYRLAPCGGSVGVELSNVPGYGEFDVGKLVEIYIRYDDAARRAINDKSARKEERRLEKEMERAVWAEYKKLKNASYQTQMNFRDYVRRLAHFIAPLNPVWKSLTFLD